jgi:hypothetical protein
MLDKPIPCPKALQEISKVYLEGSLCLQGASYASCRCKTIVSLIITSSLCDLGNDLSAICM